MNADLQRRLGRLGKFGRLTKSGLAVLLLLPLLLIWGLGQEAVLQRGLPWALQALGVPQAQLGAVHGSLWGRMQVDSFSYSTSEQAVRLQQLSLDWQPWQLLRGRIVLRELKLAHLEIEFLQSTKASMPQSLALPRGLDLVADHVLCQQVSLRQGQSLTVLRNVKLGLRSEQGAWYLAHAQLDMPWGQVRAQGNVQQLAPFQVLGELETTLPPSVPWLSAKVQISGDLRQLALSASLRGRADGKPLTPWLNATLKLTPFDSLPVTDLKVEASHLDLQRLNRAYPVTDFSLNLNAAQKQGVWSGQIQVQNAQAGSLDQGRLPLRQWVAQLGGQGSVLTMQQLHLGLGAAGDWHGKLEWDLNQILLPKLEVRTDNLNLQGLHNRLVSSKISGTVSVAGQVVRSHLAQRDLQLDLDASFGQGHVQLRQARLRAAGSQLQLAGQLNAQQFSAQGELSHFNPAQFGRFPKADINSSLKLQGQADARWQVAAQWQLASSRLLGQALAGHGQLKLDAQHLQQLVLELRLGTNYLRAQGDLGGVHDQLQWSTNWNDLSAFAWLGSLQAKGVLSGGLQQPHLEFEVQTQSLRQSSVTADGASVRASGQFDWRAASGHQPAFWRVNSSWVFEKLNPAAWGALPQAVLNGQAQLKLDSTAAVNLALHFQPGTALGQALSGQVLLDWDAQQIQGANVALNWGKNLLSVQQAPTNRALLAWELDAPALPISALPLSGHGSLLGNWQSHTLKAQLKVGATQSDWQLAGGWVTGLGWRGQVQSAAVAGLWQLQGPANLAWHWPEQAWLVQQAVFQFEGGELALEKFAWRSQEWQAQGRARGVPVTWVGALLPAWRTRLGGGLRIGGDWNLSAGEQLNGELHLARESGDLQPGPEFPKGLGLSTLRADLTVQQNTVQLQMALVGQQLGQANIRAGTRLSRMGPRWGVLGSSPLQVQANAQLDSIAPLAWLGNQAGWQYSGTLAMQVQGDGTLDTPNLRGSVKADNLGLRWINEGLVLRNGVLRAEWSGHQLQLQDLHFDGVRAQGYIELASNWLPSNAWSTQAPSRLDDKAASLLRLHLALQAQQLPVISRPDRELVVSGDANLDLDAQGLRLKGNLKADRAKIEWIADNTPTLSDDIRIVRGKQVQKEIAAPLRSNVQLELDLGSQFQVKGQGLDARIGGHLQWQALEKRGPRLVGNLSVEQGSYRAYGQNLRIERGELNFSGAWDNPGLNILALRQKADKENEVEVGVEVRGSVLAPQVRLVSTPPLADSEKLAWLVLGHGLEGAQGQELDLLGAASSAFFGKTRGNVANRLGLDELGVSYTKGVESTVITLGKRLSSRVYLSFEQGVGSATGLVKLRYTLNPRVSVQVQTGVNNAMDVFYSWRFD